MIVQETTILQQQLVRPGDRLVLYSMETVDKLALSVGRRRFFVPLDHPEKFSLLDDGDGGGKTAAAASCRLHQLVDRASVTFPLLLQLADSAAGNYVNFNDEVLPRNTALKAEVRSAESPPNTA